MSGDRRQWGRATTTTWCIAIDEGQQCQCGPPGIGLTGVGIVRCRQPQRENNVIEQCDQQGRGDGGGRTRQRSPVGRGGVNLSQASVHPPVLSVLWQGGRILEDVQVQGLWQSLWAGLLIPAGFLRFLRSPALVTYYLKE